MLRLKLLEERWLKLHKKSIRLNVKSAEKKYLAQAIWNILIELLKNLAKASITGTIIQADAFKIIAFIKLRYRLIKVL